MAAGDLTYDAGYPRSAGSEWVARGTIEVDETPRTFTVAGGTTNRILSCQLQCRDGVGVAQANTNVNASGTATNGSIGCFGNHATVETYEFDVRFLM